LPTELCARATRSEPRAAVCSKALPGCPGNEDAVAAPSTPRSERPAIVFLVLPAAAHAVHVAAVHRGHALRAALAAILADALAAHGEPAVHAVMAAEARTARSPLAAAEALARHHPMPLVRPHEAGEHGEAMLLRVVEALVERRRRIGEALERGAAGGHRV